jgi:acyl carrier protein
MKEDEIKRPFSIVKKIAPETEPSELKPDENIRETLNIDSFDALQFIVALDEKLGIEIPEQDYGKTNDEITSSYIKNKMDK